MTYVPGPSGTFLVPSGLDGLHLFVIMTKPCPNYSYLLISVSTIRPKKYYDPTCVFAGGEHEFIRVPSFVVYRRPEQRFLAGIQKCVAGGEFIVKANLDPVHFSRICAGMTQSPQRQPWAVAHFNAYR